MQSGKMRRMLIMLNVLLMVELVFEMKQFSFKGSEVFMVKSCRWESLSDEFTDIPDSKHTTKSLINPINEFNN